MSNILTAMPIEPNEFRVVPSEGKKLTARDILILADEIRRQNVPDNFRLVNSGHGLYTLRRP